jgi:D-psicose/D-tagatose/L-ribulose 3-epimerase
LESIHFYGRRILVPAISICWDQFAEHGFDGIEATLIHPTDFEASAMRRALEANDLACTVCSVLPRELSAISEDATIRAKTRTHLVDCIQVTAEAGSHGLAGPLYSPIDFFTGTRRTADEWKRAVEIYQSLEAELNSYDVQVCLEPLNRFETYFLNTTVDAIRFCDEVDNANVGILWDSFHANIEQKDLAATLRSTGRHLKHVHTCENDRGTPGSGHIDWDRIFLALNQLGYNGWLTIESFGFALGAIGSSIHLERFGCPSGIDRMGWYPVLELSRRGNSYRGPGSNGTVNRLKPLLRVSSGSPPSRTSLVCTSARLTALAVAWLSPRPVPH